MNELQEQMRNRWDEKGGGYDESSAHGVDNHEALNQWKQLFQQDGRESLEVLDVGAGTGFVTLLAAELGHRVTAIDWSNTMLNQAMAKAQAKGLDIKFEIGLTEQLPFSNDRFDVLTARHVVWTLSQPEKTFSEWYRVLKPGGIVWVDYAHRGEERKGAHYSEDVENQLPLNKDVPPEIIAEMFRNAGFNSSDFRIMDDRHHTVYLFSCQK